MKEGEQMRFKTGGEKKDNELEQVKRMGEQKKGVEEHFKVEKRKKDLEHLEEVIQGLGLSEEEWEALARKRKQYHDSKP